MKQIKKLPIMEFFQWLFGFSQPAPPPPDSMVQQLLNARAALKPRKENPANDLLESQLIAGRSNLKPSTRIIDSKPAEQPEFLQRRNSLKAVSRSAIIVHKQ